MTRVIRIKTVRSKIKRENQVSWKMKGKKIKRKGRKNEPVSWAALPNAPA